MDLTEWITIAVVLVTVSIPIIVNLFDDVTDRAFNRALKKWEDD